MAHKAERVARDSGADLQIAIAAAWLVRLHVARGDLAEAGALGLERSANVGGAAARQKGRTDSLRRVPAHYPRKLMSVLDQNAAGATPSAAGLSEPLSERELEVLRLIASGKSNRQISSELFVSVGTVKTHINNLYRKIDAHSRTQALARARELNLL